jgi:hypothetical protein
MNFSSDWFFFRIFVFFELDNKKTKRMWRKIKRHDKPKKHRQITVQEMEGGDQGRIKSTQVVLCFYGIVFVINLQIAFSSNGTCHLQTGEFIDNMWKLNLCALLNHIHIDTTVAAKCTLVHFFVVYIMDIHLNYFLLYYVPFSDYIRYKALLGLCTIIYNSPTSKMLFWK